jgi:hypothetical protein
VLKPLAAWLRHERTAEAGEQAVAELKRIGRTFDRIPLGHVPQLPRGGLPGEVKHFTGRQGQLEELLRRAEDRDRSVRAVTIDGMPGVGKTAFAVHAAYRLAERYPDGAIFLDLYGFTPGLEPLPVHAALEQLLRDAGVSGESIPSGHAERRAMWRSEMNFRKMLILLDNARDADQVASLSLMRRDVLY